MDRSGARKAAVQLLYEWEMGGDGGPDTRLGMLELHEGENGLDWMEALFEGAKEHVATLDQEIQKYAVGWSLERITRVDLSILRVAAYEILYEDTPGAVAINEAVELSRLFSTEKAGGFINGVLGSMLRALKRS